MAYVCAFVIIVWIQLLFVYVFHPQLFAQASCAHTRRAFRFLQSVARSGVAMPATFIKSLLFKCPGCKQEKTIEKESLYPPDCVDFKRPQQPRCFNDLGHGRDILKKFKIMRFKQEKYFERTRLGNGVHGDAVSLEAMQRNVEVENDMTSRPSAAKVEGANSDIG